MFATIDVIISRTSSLLKYVAAALLIGVAIVIAVDVFLRGVVSRPIIGVAEVVANGIVIIAYLQLSYTVRIGAMLRSDLLVNALPHRPRILLESCVAMLGILFFGLMAWASYEPMIRAIASGEFEGHASLQVPTWPVRTIIVVCSILAVINYLAIAYRALVYGDTTPDNGEKPAEPALGGN